MKSYRVPWLLKDELLPKIGYIGCITICSQPWTKAKISIGKYVHTYKNECKPCLRFSLVTQVPVGTSDILKILDVFQTSFYT